MPSIFPNARDGGVQIVAGSESASRGAVTFANSNGVTFGLSGSVLTAAVAGVGTATAQGGVHISAGTTFISSGTLQFMNSNGISFGVDANGLLTASYTVPNVPAQSVQTQNIVNGVSAGTTNLSDGGVSFANSNGVTFGLSGHTLTASISPSGTQSSLSFANSNGISFGTNGSTVTASYTVPNVPAQSVQTQNMVSVNGSTGNISFQNGNNVTFGANASTITASVSFAQSVQPVAVSGSNGSFVYSTLSLGNSNGVSFYTTNGSIVASYTVPNVPAQTSLSYQNDNNVSFGLNGSTITATATFNQSVQTQNMVSVNGSTGNISFANGNGITFGGNASTVTASHNGLTSQSNQAVSGSNGSFTFQTLSLGNSNGASFYTTNGSLVASYTVPGATVFSNSNNVSFGLNGSTITATATFNQSVQTQNIVMVGASNGIITSGSVSLANSNNVSFGTTLSNGSQLITASANAAGVGDGFNILAAGTQTAATTGTINFANSNGISFGMSGSNQITASYTVPNVPAQSVQTQNMVSVLGSTGNISFANSNGVTIGANASTITISHNGLTSQSNQAVSGSNGSFAFQTVTFGNSNGVSFYTTNGSLVASYTVPNVPAQTAQPVAVSGSNGSFLFSTLSLGNSNGASFYTTNGSVVVSYTVPTQSVQTQNLVSVNGSTGNISFQNGNNVTFGFNASTVTASASFAQSVQPVGSFGVSNLGNTVGTSGTFTNRMVLSGGNNITLSQSTDGNGITVGFSGPNVGGAQTGISSIGVSDTTYTSGGITITGSNLVTVRSTTGQGIVIDVTTQPQSVQPVAVSGSNGSFAFSTVTFGNSNGVSFYTTNGSIVASYTVPTIPGATVFSNSNNVSFGLNGSTVTATATFAQSVQTQNLVSINGSTGNISFANGNGITFGGNASTVTASHNALTSQSNQAVSGSNGSFTFQTLSLGNSNGVSFYTTNGSVVASYTVPSQSVQTQNMVSVNGSTGNISFQNGNNVTFGFNASTVTASASFAQTAQPVAVSGSNGSFVYSTLSLGNSNGVSFYTTNGSVVASYTVPTQTVQTQNLHNVTISGNTVGVGAAISSGTLSLAGGNNITLSQNGNALTISGPNTIAQSVQPVAVSGSNGSFAFSTVTFGNSNGMSFYTTNGSLVGSYTVPTQSVQTQNMVSVNGSTGNISFQNGNNITFGVNASTITASASFNQSVQTQNVHNVTIAGNTAGVGAAISSGTLSLAGGNNITISQNGNALTISGPNVGGAQTGISGISGGTTQMTSGTAVFGNANNVSFGVDGNTITASASFNQTVQPVALSGSNGSFAFSTVTFGNSNGVSFYTTNGSVVASYTVPTIPGATVFSNSNNVSFGLNGSTITATATFNQSVQTQNMVSVLGSTGNISFANGNGITFGANASTITISHNGLTSQSNQAVSGSNGSFAFQTLSLGNSNGVSFYTTNGSIVASYTVPTQTVQTQNIVVPAATNGTITSGTVIFHTSGGNVTFGTTLTNGSQLITASAPAGGAGGIVFANSQTTYTSGTVSLLEGGGAITIASTTGQRFNISVPAVSVLTGGNNVSISTNGSTVSVIAQAPALAATNGTVTSGTVIFHTSGGNITFGTTVTNGSILMTGSAPSGGAGGAAISAGTESQNTGTVIFSNSNGVSFGLNAGTLTASVNAGGAGITYDGFNPFKDIPLVVGQMGNASIQFDPMRAENFTCDRVVIGLHNSNSSNSSGSHTLSFQIGLYTKNASTLSLLASTSFSTAVTHSGTVGSYSHYSGLRLLTAPWSTSFSAGDYWLAFWSRTTSGGTNGSYSNLLISNLNSNITGMFGAAATATVQLTIGQGVYSNTSTALPSSAAFSHITGSGSANWRMPFVDFAVGTM